MIRYLVVLGALAHGTVTLHPTLGIGAAWVGTARVPRPCGLGCDDGGFAGAPGERVPNVAGRAVADRVVGLHGADGVDAAGAGTRVQTFLA